MFNKLRHQIEFLKCKLLRRFKLEELPFDERDLKLGDLGWGHYEPKNQRVLLSSGLPFKTQRFNTCTFNSRAASKEFDEGMPLSVDYLVKKAASAGYISGDGFANLRASEIIAQKQGVCEERLLPRDSNSSWGGYSDASVITEEMDANAALHKSQSFWSVSNKYQLWKLLDEGRTVRVGSVWKTAFNAGFLQAPWVLNFNEGIVVGGHAYLVVGYDRNLEGNDVFICQNSYGPNWGDKGRFNIKVEDLENAMAKYGAFADLDMPKDVGKFLQDNEGKTVKSASTPDIYLIEKGKKRHFPDLATLYVHGFADSQIIVDADNLLPQIEDGQAMDFWQGKEILTVKTILLQREHLKEIFIKYFSDLKL